MSSNPKQAGSTDFVGEWLQSRKTEGAMNSQILELIEKHTSSDALNEAALLSGLLDLADRAEAADAAG